MIDVEHGALRALEQHAFSIAHGVVEQLRRVTDHGTNPVGEPQVLIADFFVVDGFLNIEGLRQKPLILGQECVHRTEAFALVQVRDANATPAGLVLVAWPNAARCGSNGHAVLAAFRHFFHDSMKGKNHVGPVADGKLPGDVYAGLSEHFYLVDQSRRIHYNAVSDDCLDAGTQYPAGNQLENEFLLADKDRVAGVVPTLVTRHDRKLFGE